MQDIVAADELYNNRLLSEPGNQEADFFRAVTRILRLWEESRDGPGPSTFTDSVKEMLDRFGRERISVAISGG